MKSRKFVIISLIIGLLSVNSIAMASGQLAPRSLYIRDDNGVPITGGIVSWSMKDGSARSAMDYGLTSDGLITFPYAPEGLAKVKLVDGQMASGDLVSGNYEVYLETRTDLRIALAPTHEYPIRVLSPSGEGVAGALVKVPTHCPNYATTTFHSSQGTNYGDYKSRVASQADYNNGYYDSYTAVTDNSGWAIFYGYLRGSACRHFTVTYNDGIVIQTVKGTFDEWYDEFYSNQVELPYAPIVTVMADAVTVNEGVAVSLPVSIGLSDSSSARQNFISSRSRHVSGAQVRVLLPSGAAKGNCGAKLSGRTNAKGRVTLRICATKSGKYRISAKGILRNSGVLVHVRGSAPMPVTSVTARSPRVGSLKASWNAPLYTGGAKITQYQAIIVDTKSGKSINRVLGRSRTSLRLTGLAHARKYTIKIYAKTKYGTSDPIIKSVTVA